MGGAGHMFQTGQVKQDKRNYESFIRGRDSTEAIQARIDAEERKDHPLGSRLEPEPGTYAPSYPGTDRARGTNKFNQNTYDHDLYGSRDEQVDAERRQAWEGAQGTGDYLTQDPGGGGGGLSDALRSRPRRVYNPGQTNPNAPGSRMPARPGPTGPPGGGGGKGGGSGNKATPRQKNPFAAAAQRQGFSDFDG